MPDLTTDYINIELFEDIADEIVNEAEDELLTNVPKCFKELQMASEKEFRYKIIDEVNHGGMKVIHKAIDLKTRRCVALALIKCEHLSEKDLRYFIQEAWITARLEHPNIVPLHDVGITPDGAPYFIMKLLKGENLWQIIEHIRSGNKEYLDKYTSRALLNGFIKVCDAIAYAHESGVLHLDLKPDNIQISDFGQVLVMDWGIALLRNFARYPDESNADSEEDTFFEQTSFNVVKGTPGFIAPELVASPDTIATQKADIYGLGAILFSILTFKKPNSNVRGGDIFERGRHRVPTPLKAIVRKAMHRDPEERYESVMQMKDDIELFLAGYAATAENAGFWRQNALLLRRHGNYVATVSMALITLLLVTLFFTVQLNLSKKIAVENSERAVTSERRALGLESLAKDKEVQAGLLLKQYRQEKIAKEKHQKTTKRYWLYEVYHALCWYELDQAWSSIQKILAINPNYRDADKYAMTVLLAQQKFGQLITEFPHLRDDNKYQLSEKYSKLKSDEELLGGEVLEEFLRDLIAYEQDDSMLLVENVFHMVNKGKTFKDEEARIRSRMSLFYPNTNIEYDKELDRVTLTGRDVEAVALLAGLSFKGLDLSESKLSRAWVLGSFTELEYLNLKRTGVKGLSPLKKLKKLRYLDLGGVLPVKFPQLLDLRKFEYISFANTSIRLSSYNNFQVKKINLVGADKIKLESIVSLSNPPELILISPSHIDQYKKLRDEDKLEHITVVVCETQADVDRELRRVNLDSFSG